MNPVDQAYMNYGVPAAQDGYTQVARASLGGDGGGLTVPARYQDLISLAKSSINAGVPPDPNDKAATQMYNQQVQDRLAQLVKGKLEEEQKKRITAAIDPLYGGSQGRAGGVIKSPMTPTQIRGYGHLQNPGQFGVDTLPPMDGLTMNADAGANELLSLPDMRFVDGRRVLGSQNILKRAVEPSYSLYSTPYDSTQNLYKIRLKRLQQANLFGDLMDL